MLDSLRRATCDHLWSSSGKFSTHVVVHLCEHNATIRGGLRHYGRSGGLQHMHGGLRQALLISRSLGFVSQVDRIMTGQKRIMTRNDLQSIIKILLKLLPTTDYCLQNEDCSSLFITVPRLCLRIFAFTISCGESEIYNCQEGFQGYPQGSWWQRKGASAL